MGDPPLAREVGGGRELRHAGRRRRAGSGRARGEYGPTGSDGVWQAMAQLAKTGEEGFVRYGIARMTRGGVSEELAEQMLERFPDMELVSAMVDALGESRESIGDDLAAIDAPMLLAKHEGCLGRTDEGFEDIVAAFPDARTVICPECSSSPTFARAIQSFCEELGRS